MNDVKAIVTSARIANLLCPQLKSSQVIYHLCLLMTFLQVIHQYLGHSQTWLSSSLPLTAAFYDL